jgi:type IV pilus assembly protein PilO
MKKNTQGGALAPMMDKIEGLTKAQRIGVFVGFLVTLLLGVGWFSIYPKWEEIGSLEETLASARVELEKAKKNASELNEWRSRMMEKEAEYKTVMQQLPESAEIPTLLAGISQAGKDAGLEFLLFQPKNEDPKEFFAEIPVDINISGSYHQVAMFFEKVSNLPRIVNIRDVKMTPQPKDGKTLLTTVCQAVTYKFIEASPPGRPGSNAGRSQ